MKGKKYMLVAIDVDSGDVSVYKTENLNPTVKGKVTIDAESVQGQPLEKTLSVNGKTAVAIPDYTVIRTHSSPGCTTYTYQGHTWTVCT